MTTFMVFPYAPGIQLSQSFLISQLVYTEVSSLNLVLVSRFPLPVVLYFQHSANSLVKTRLCRLYFEYSVYFYKGIRSLKYKYVNHSGVSGTIIASFIEPDIGRDF